MIASLRRPLAAAVCAVALSVHAQAPAEKSAGGPQQGAHMAKVGELLERVDAAWPKRDDPAQMETIRSALKEAEALAPQDYGVLWRLSRLNFWLADDLTIPEAEKSRLGKISWEQGDRAAAVNPAGVEGWFFAAGGMGNYALGIGVLTALTQGIEGKLKDHLSKAESINPTYLQGGIFNAWGRLYYELPWPKYDARKSEASLFKAIKINPDNVRARVYLAELYLKESHPKEAKKLLQEAISHEPGRYDAPEERRYQTRAKELLKSLK
jgi:tetratricopeptide (TPR) repeat protein